MSDDTRLFEESPLPSWIHDAGTKEFLAVNRAARLFYGYDAEEFRELTPRELRPDRRTTEFGGGESVVVHRRKDGSLAEMSLLGVPVVFAGRDAVLVVAQDVSERRRVENQIRQAQKFEAVGRLAGGVAHDFNNILTAVLGFSDYVLTRLEPESPLRRPVGEIRKAGERAAQLTRQLLAFGRRQLLSPEVVEVNTLVRGAAQNLQRVVGEKVRVRTALADDAGAVFADPGQIEQALFHLAMNARDAMPRGGAIEIETRHVIVTEEEARLRFPMVPGTYVFLGVADTGEGMDADVKEHAFEPFFTTKAGAPGAGLGLASVYGIVKQSGGFVWAESEKGKGTSMEIYLPRAESRKDAVTLPSLPRSRGAGSRVLVVEDEEMVRTLVASLLSEQGYSVLTAASGEEALGLIADPATTIDLLLSDVVMPGIDGPALARRACAMRAGLRVLLMSGYADQQVVRDGILDRGLTVLSKPFSRSELVERVREALAEAIEATPRAPA